MRIAVFGLSISSAWGNGHATLWRGLAGALSRAGHRIVFFEKDAPYYAAHRDATDIPGCDLVLYDAFVDVLPRMRRELAGCDAAIVTSFCPDALRASRLVLSTQGVRSVFYDLDTPVTLDMLGRGETVPYLPEEGLAAFDLVLSFTGGKALAALRTQLGARRVAALYGSVDPAIHKPVAADPRFEAELSYMGTYAADRQGTVDALFLGTAQSRPTGRFLLAGANYPSEIVRPPNVTHHEHVAPGEHARFYASAKVQLNVTRAVVARWGHCPSGRLFEAAACGATMVTDPWPGLESFFEPGQEIFVTRTAADVAAVLDLGDDERKRVSKRAQERVLSEHSSARRARQLVEWIEGPTSRRW